MQSISDARFKWAEATKPDQLLMHEQERRLWEVIKKGIEDGQHHVIYEVPWVLHGPWPIFNVDEVTLELIRRARNKGYRVQMIRRTPPTLELSGWAPHNKTRYHQALETSAPSSKSNGASGGGGNGRRKKQSKNTQPEVTLNDAKKGLISNRLRQRLARLK